MRGRTALLIGGTGTISEAVAKKCVRDGWEVYLLNRGNRPDSVPEGARVIVADARNPEDMRAKLGDMRFDVVADFIAYTEEQALADVELFRGRTKQYIFISSASVYQKPLSMPFITESTPLSNPYWQYSKDKIACEEALMAEYRRSGFPVTIVRPSHTYDRRSVPMGLRGKNGSFAVVERIRTGKKVIVPGDGLTLWTFTHSDDFAIGFCGLMGNPHAIGEAFHITGDERITWNQALAIVGDALGVEPKLTHIASDTLAALCPGFYGALLGDKSHTAIFDNTKIKRAVPEFTATIRFDQGIRETLAHIYAHEELRKPDPEFDQWCDALIGQYESAAKNWPRYDMR